MPTVPIEKRPECEAYCEEYVRNGGNAHAAYGKCIAKQGSKPTSWTPAASRLMKNPNITQRIAEIRETTKAKVEVTAEDIVEQLDADRKFARENGQAAAAVKATEAKARLLGLDKNETNLTIRPDDARQIISQFLAKYAADLVVGHPNGKHEALSNGAVQ